MLVASSGFKAALIASHRAAVRVQAWQRAYSTSRLTPTYVADLPLEGGNLTIDCTGDYWRTADLTIANEEIDSTGRRVSDILNVADSILTIEAGVEVDGDIEWVKLCTLKVDRVERRSLASTIAVTATDEGSRLNDIDIIAPWPNITEPTTEFGMIATIQKFVNDTFPGDNEAAWTISDEAASRSTWQWRQTLTWQGSRWEQVNALARALGVWVYNGPDAGDFRMAKLPALSSDPVWELKPGEWETLEAASSDDNRDELFNIVYVRYESPADGSSYAMWKDDDEDSPTYWAGPFGERIKVVDNDIVNNADDALDLAKDLVKQYSTRGSATTLSAVWNPLLFPGDHVQVIGPDGEEYQHIVQRVTIPFPPGRMEVGTRLASLGVVAP